MTKKRAAGKLGVSVLMTLLVSSTFASAQDSAESQGTRTSHFHADVEIDPFAYAFGGYSAHVGVGYRGLRFDLGAFALDTPGFLESDSDFESSRNGYGVKLQYFPFAEQTGGFFGVQAEIANDLVESNLSNAAHREKLFNVGANLGWRFPIGNFYVMPWLLVNYAVGSKDIQLDGKTYEPGAFSVLPTVHVGYRFF